MECAPFFRISYSASVQQDKTKVKQFEEYLKVNRKDAKSAKEASEKHLATADKKVWSVLLELLHK